MKIPLVLLLALPLAASPKWKAPSELPFGDLAIIELFEEDLNQPPIPRPAEEKLGSLAIRSVEPTPDGRGWRFSVQAFQPGRAFIPVMDLGDGRRTPELRLMVSRTVPYGSPWMGVGGGQDDILPYLPFPWLWATLLLLPLLPFGWWGARVWIKTSNIRRLNHAKHEFAKHWPPRSKQRELLDSAHAAGRELLAARFGDDARSWGSVEFQNQRLEIWVEWSNSIDAARFARKEPPFPRLQELLKALEVRR